MKEKVLPQAKRKADAESDPIEAILLLVERKADEAYLEYALKRIIRIYKKRGQMEKAAEVALTRTRSVDRPWFLIDLAFDYAEQGKKKEALALLEKAIVPSPQPLKEEWQIERRGSTLAMIASAYIRLEAPERARPLLEQALPMAHSAPLLAEIAAGYAGLGEKEKADAAFAHAGALKKRWDGERMEFFLAKAGRYEEARKPLDEIDTVSRRGGLLLSLATAAARNGDHAVASKFLEEVLALAREEGASQAAETKAREWLRLARSVREAGEMKWAVRFLERAEESVDAIRGNPLSQESLLLSISEEYWEAGEPQRISRLIDRVPVKDSMGRSTQDGSLPALYARIGKIEQALLILERYEMGDGKVWGRLQVAQVLWEKGHRGDALALLARTESEFRETVLKKEPGYHHEMLRLSSQYASFGEEEAPLRILMEAENMVLLHGAPFGRVSALIDIAKQYVDLHQAERVDKTLSKAVELTDAMNDRWEGPGSYRRIASLYADAGLSQRAQEVEERIKGDDAAKRSGSLDPADQASSEQTDQKEERLAGEETDEEFRLLDQTKERDGKIWILSRMVASHLKPEAALPEASMIKIKSLLKELDHGFTSSKKDAAG